MTTLEILHGTAAEAVANEAGFGPRRISESAVASAARLLGEAFKGGRLATLRLAEAMTTSDFQNAAFEVLDRQLLERYEDLPATWSEYATKTTVRDFKAKTLVDLMGGQAALDLVPELNEYPARSISKRLYTLKVAKYGGRFAISWEAMVNDELGELQNLPQNLAVGSRDTESRIAAGLLTDGDGPNGAIFNATAWGKAADGTGGSSNLIAGNPVLSTTSLTDALTAIGSRRDPEGRPIVVSGYVLVVPPALAVAAYNIVNATEIRLTSGTQETIVGNWLSGRVRVVVEPWLSVLDVGANSAKTWYLLPDPKSSRPALHIGFLRGHEVPDLRVKSDTGQRVGGGDIPASDGSFDIDDIQYRVRHVAGSVGGDMIATAASTGAAV